MVDQRRYNNEVLDRLNTSPRTIYVRLFICMIIYSSIYHIHNRVLLWRRGGDGLPRREERAQRFRWSTRALSGRGSVHRRRRKEERNELGPMAMAGYDPAMGAETVVADGGDSVVAGSVLIRSVALALGF